jgi:hypothetical protein
MTLQGSPAVAASLLALLAVSGCGHRSGPPARPRSCADEAGLASPRLTPPHFAKFENASSAPVALIWRNHEGQRAGFDLVPPLGRLESSGYEGGVVVVADEQSRCLDLFTSEHDRVSYVWDGARIVSAAETPRALALLRERRGAADAAFRNLKLEGFEVHVSPEADAHPETAKALQLLADALQRGRSLIPPSLASALAPVSIWVEWRERTNNALFQFPRSPEEMAALGENPARAHAIVLANVRNFIDVLTHDQPHAVLHELAHSLHDLVLGRDNAELEALYQAVLGSEKLESARHARGPNRRAYALNNAYEYFAEQSVAYLAVNSVWPFVRTDLPAADGPTFDFLVKFWGQTPALPQLVEEGCVAPTERPKQYGELTAILFVNQTGRALKLVTTTEEGAQASLKGPGPDKPVRYLAHRGQPFVVTEEDGACLGRYTAQGEFSEVVVTSTVAADAAGSP